MTTYRKFAGPDSTQVIFNDVTNPYAELLVNALNAYEEPE